MANKSRKKKAEGKEKHRLQQRAKKMAKKEKKKISLPTRHKNKGRK